MQFRAALLSFLIVIVPGLLFAFSGSAKNKQIAMFMRIGAFLSWVIAYTYWKMTKKPDENTNEEDLMSPGTTVGQLGRTGMTKSGSLGAV